jgi:4-amino-4-deoxy-L-arabinose transferase-like glycosyltransferase
MAEITKTGNSSSQFVPKWAWMGFAILAILAYLFGLSIPFLGPDEPRYAQVAREMFERGDWVTPTLGGFNWFEKPALLYWLEIAAYKGFGVSEFAARLGPALFGLGTVASLWILGRKSAPPMVAGGLTRLSETTSFANWLALIAASTLGIYVFAHGASFDIIITFPMTAALVAFYLYDRGVRPPATADVSGLAARPHIPVALILFYVFIGIALLAKGLIGIVFPIAIVGLFYVFSRRLPTGEFTFSLFWGTLLAAAIACLWYLPMYQRHGWEFIDEFFIQHHFQRFTSNKYQHPQPFYFFFWVLPLMTLPWMPFAFASVWSSVRRLFSGAKPQPLILFAFAWLIVPLGFFSLSGSKLPGYILPAIPAAVVLAAVYIFEKVAKSHRWANSVFAVASLVFIISIGVSITVVPKFADTDSVSGLIAAAAERGYTSERVFGLHTISHSAEFYAANRLLRDSEGRQKKLYSPAEVVAEMRRANVARALVLVPPEYLRQITETGILRNEVIRDNGEWVIVAVWSE